MIDVYENDSKRKCVWFEKWFHSLDIEHEKYKGKWYANTHSWIWMYQSKAIM